MKANYRAGKAHPGIVTVPIPVLNSKLYEDENSEVTAVNFLIWRRAAEHMKNIFKKIKAASDSDLNYLGLAIFGPKKKVEHLTGNLPLFR